ncbi:MAG: cation:proton antiporter [Methanobrevibacter sp.]|jgi:energy-converting hydrogenase B subunit I|nr:cation:proton antiporter [Candidatus Methanovirga meridionalis]
MSTILKIFVFPATFIIICLGILTILGGHITPGGGFQGGAMIAGGIILSILVYGVEKSPIQLSHEFISNVESVGALGYILLGLAGLLTSGFFLYNVGTDFYNLIPTTIATLFHYPDVTNAGFIPYLNILVGLKVFVGLSAIVIAFSQFKKNEGNSKEKEKNEEL